MACGDKYAHLLRTATGLTPEDPCPSLGKLCVTGSYDSWFEAVARIANEAKRRADVLAAATEPVPPQLRERMEAYFAAMADLPTSTWWDPFTLERALIDRAIEVGTEGICVMELLDDEIVAQGLTIPGTAAPPKPEKPDRGPVAEAIGTLAVGVLVIGSGWAIWKVSRNTA